MIWLAFVCTAFVSAAMSEHEVERYAGLGSLQPEPLIIISRECPVCLADFSQENRRIIGDKVTLSACTENLPNSAEHAFHESCITRAYAEQPRCPICRRILDEAELEVSTQRRSKKVWYYGKRIAQGIPYGLMVGAEMELIHFFGNSQQQQIILPVFTVTHLLVSAMLWTVFRSEATDIVQGRAL